MIPLSEKSMSPKKKPQEKKKKRETSKRIARKSMVGQKRFSLKPQEIKYNKTRNVSNKHIKFPDSTKTVKDKELKLSNVFFHLPQLNFKLKVNNFPESNPMSKSRKSVYDSFVNRSFDNNCSSKENLLSSGTPLWNNRRYSICQKPNVDSLVVRRSMYNPNSQL